MQMVAANAMLMQRKHNATQTQRKRIRGALALTIMLHVHCLKKTFFRGIMYVHVTKIRGVER